MMNSLSFLFVCFFFASMYVFVSSPTSTDPIDAALDAVEVEYALIPDFANACTLSVANTVVDTNQGAFVLCRDSFQAAIRFFALDGRNVTLAAFTDDEVDMYGTNKVSNGNVCKEVYDVIGRSCFAQAAGLAAQSYMPRWKNQNNQTASTVANFIGSTFSSQATLYAGAIGRCYPNSAKFYVVGLSSANALNAVKVHDSKYGACEISEGDPRFWAGVSWSIYQRIGALLVGGGTLMVAVLIPCLSCCLQ